jgi:uncharacterized protein
MSSHSSGTDGEGAGATAPPDAATLLARRESSIVLDREGRFLHDGTLIEHPGIVAAFRKWIARGEGGRFILRASEREWCFLTVEGPASWVEDVAWRGDGATLGLWDGTREPLDPSSLRIDAEGVLTCIVRGLPARFSRHAQLALGERLGADADGAFVLDLGGTRHRILS